MSLRTIYISADGLGLKSGRTLGQRAYIPRGGVGHNGCGALSPTGGFNSPTKGPNAIVIVRSKMEICMQDKMTSVKKDAAISKTKSCAVAVSLCLSFLIALG